MKAEQRKELETNTLADRMGRMVQRVKTGQRRTFFFYFFILGAIVVASWIGYRWYANSRFEDSQNWFRLYDGSRPFIGTLAQRAYDGSTNNADKAALFQVAWSLYWDNGIKILGQRAPEAIKNLKDAGRLYDKLAERCKDDKVFLPQALLGEACVEETLAVESRDHLDKAKTLYQKIIADCPESAEVKYAKQRLDRLKEGDGRDLSNTYGLIQIFLNVPPPLPATKDR